MRLLPLSFAAVLPLAIALPTPVLAWDSKALPSAPNCIAYAPDTTAAELQFTPTGIYNPGTSIEKVICTVPRDVESKYDGANGIYVDISYRVLGGAPGRLTCTLFIGNSTQNADSIWTNTASGALVANGQRSGVEVALYSQGTSAVFVPNTLVCAISPKTSMSTIVVTEHNATEI